MDGGGTLTHPATPPEPGSGFRLGTLLVSPATNEIDGSHIDPKAMDVLVALADAASGVISVAQLLDRVWPNVVVGDNAVHQAIATLRRALGDDARAPRYVQSIPRRGYRLIARVERLHAAAVGNAAASEHGPDRTATGTENSADLLAPTGATETHASTAEKSTTRASPTAVTSPATSPLLAVLAFDNVSGDQELAYFSDGVSEEIRDTVARGTGLRVIGRASSFQFRGADKAAANVAAQLHTTHVLDGSVRRNGPRVRISAELVECATATTLWADRFDRDLSDIFVLQDEIAAAIAEALRVAFAPTQHSRGVDAAAFDAYLRARAAATGYLGAYDTKLLEAAVALEPRLTNAWAALALTLAVDAFEPGSFAPARPATVMSDLRLRARHAVERALELDPDAALAHAALAALVPNCGAFARSEVHLRRAVATDPHDPFVLGRVSRWHWSVGRVQEGLAYQAHAFEIDPLIPAVVQHYSMMLRSVGRDIEADAIAASARERWPTLDFLAIAPLHSAALRQDWQVFDRLKLDVAHRGPHTSRMRRAIADLEPIRAAGISVAGGEHVVTMRRDLAETGTVSLRSAVFACDLGLASEAYPLLMRASFTHLFQLGPRLVADDVALHWLFGYGGGQPIPPLMTRDIRFVQLCANLGLCDYWIQSNTWPDCAEQLTACYDFKAEVRRLVATG